MDGVVPPQRMRDARALRRSGSVKRHAQAALPNRQVAGEGVVAGHQHGIERIGHPAVVLGIDGILQRHGVRAVRFRNVAEQRHRVVRERPQRTADPAVSADSVENALVRDFKVAPQHEPVLEDERKPLAVHLRARHRMPDCRRLSRDSRIKRQGTRRANRRRTQEKARGAELRRQPLRLFAVCRTHDMPDCRVFVERKEIAGRVLLLRANGQDRPSPCRFRAVLPACGRRPIAHSADILAVAGFRTRRGQDARAQHHGQPHQRRPNKGISHLDFVLSRRVELDSLLHGHLVIRERWQ